MLESVGGVLAKSNLLRDMPDKTHGPNLGDVAVYESRRSGSIALLATSLLMAQKNLKPAPKDHDNPFFNSRYADLGACMDAVKEAYNAEDIAVIQRPLDTDGTTICIETMLIHSSGEYISGILRLKPIKADPQGLGSCLTYARRYALGAITGLVTEEDDDGNAASTPAAPKAPPKPPFRTAAAPAAPPPPPPMAPRAAPPEQDKSWLPSAAYGYLKAINVSKKLTQKNERFGDLTLEVAEGQDLVLTWFGFSEPWTYETLRDHVCGTAREVKFTMIPPSNPRYKPTLEHIHVEDEPDPAQ
jgi:hypothetical protein